MKYCTKCGKELFDEAVICPGCGCPTQLYQQKKAKTKPVRRPTEKRPRKKMSKKAKIILVILLAVVVLAGIVAAVLFLPRNIEIGDFSGKQSKFNCLITFGLPTGELTDGSWYYEDRISIRGIKMECLTVDFENEEYRLQNNSTGTQFAISTYIKLNCDYGGTQYQYFDVYYYEDLAITAGGWMTVYITHKD